MEHDVSSANYGSQIAQTTCYEYSSLGNNRDRYIEHPEELRYYPFIQISLRKHHEHANQQIY